MKMNKREKGKKSEDMAKNFLLSKGYRFIQRNFYTKSGEIDLIFEDNNEIVFVEVKSSKGDYYGQPEERIDRTKVKRLTGSARIFLAANKIHDKDCRFDVIAILYDDDNSAKINHIKNAFWGDESKN
ncbi:YraN family protein [candidate division KSB1 bacterium]